MRTYAGHSSASASNALFRRNLAKGQTGLSVAFDLPTQVGCDADDPRADGEVGRVGVPISHLGDMRALFDGIPVEAANTSMTINATAPWLFALYVALAEERGVDPIVLNGTTQNDLLKEYLSRGTYVFPPEASLRLTADLIVYAVEHVPKWNPINISSYHLQEAGATPVQELAFALVAAISVLDHLRERGIEGERLALAVGRISFFVNAGMRFVEETCKMRAFVALWDRITAQRYGVEDDKLRRFRYGVQVNSLGLTEQQPENNIIRIAYEMLGVTLSRDARARAVQLPAWNEALGLPRPWDQQWSLRAQQILAYESDLLDHGDLFAGNPVIEGLAADLADRAWREIEEIVARGGAVQAVESGALKRALVESNARRLLAIESGEQVVVGVNRFATTEVSPLTADLEEVIETVGPEVEREQWERLRAFRSRRDASAVRAAIEGLSEAARTGQNIVPPSIRAAHAGVTTGEWTAALRTVFGDYRAPTAIAIAVPAVATADGAEQITALRDRLRGLEERLGRRPKILIGKPGLDGHSNGAEQIALKARDVGFEVVYEGIRLSPDEIAASALEEGAHLVGISILSGAHMRLVPALLQALRTVGLDGLPVIVGGIVPKADADALRTLGVERVYTPKDYSLSEIMADLIALLEQRRDHVS